MITAQQLTPEDESKLADDIIAGRGRLQASDKVLQLTEASA